jgi:hypothetical protein
VRKSERIAPDRRVSIQEIRGARGFDLRQFQTIGYLVIFCSTGELPHTEAYFYRRAAGTEIDLVLTVNGKLWANEVKHSTTPKLTKGFHLAARTSNPTINLLCIAVRKNSKPKMA